jgi:LuxR family maltose regulon positive regulatory protein
VRQGQLHRVAELYRQARLLGEQQGGVVLGPTGVVCVEYGEVLREWNDLEAAKRILLEGIDLCRQQMSMPEYVLEGHITLARVCHASGDSPGAVAAMQQAEHSLTELHLRTGNVQVILSQALGYRVRLWLAQGDLGAAARWTDEKVQAGGHERSGLSMDDTLLLARVRLAHGQADQALELLWPLHEAADAGHRPGAVIEILLLTALAWYTLDDPAQAVDALVRVIPLAEKENYIRLFVDEGEPMRRILEKIDAHIAPDYVSRVLSAFPANEYGDASSAQMAHGSVDDRLGTAVARPPMEPLNEREQQILGLMAARLSNQQIADELHLSINTVKWYARNLYTKLDVANRTQAVDRAQELRIL